MKNLKYPIGPYRSKKSVTHRDVARWIDEIEQLPEWLRSAVATLTDEQLDSRYREDGWTLRQLIHHIADSHLNGYQRIKLALTEENPAVKTYNQDLWAKFNDYQMDIEVSLNFIDSLHKRWTHLLKSLDEEQLDREFIHPKNGRSVVKSLIGRYAWHGKHHLAHITNFKKQEN